MFYGGPFCWMSKKQKSVAWSSCELEYIAQAMYAVQGQWAAQIFQDLGMPEYVGKNGTTVDMCGDNQGALALVKNPHLHEWSKHIDVCYYYICDLAEKKRLEVEYVSTTEMPADGFTKPLTQVTFEHFRGQLGVATDWCNMCIKRGIIQGGRAARSVGECWKSWYWSHNWSCTLIMWPCVNTWGTCPWTPLTLAL